MRAIITFHGIDTADAVLSYPPSLFASLLEALERCKLPVCSLDALLAEDAERGVALTFDDGMRSVFMNALPVIREHQVPAHLFLTTGAVGGDNRWPTQPDDAPRYEMLNWGEVEALHAAGVYIESHTHNHPDLRQLSEMEIREECDTADTIIEHRLGRLPRYFAYPYGYISDVARSVTARRYAAAVTTELRCLTESEDSVVLPRLDSYYLKSRWLISNLDSGLARLYLGARGFMREIRGTQ